MKLVNTTYLSAKDKVLKLQDLKGKTELKFYQNTNNYYVEMKSKNFRFEKESFGKDARGFSKIYHEVLKLLQIKSQVKNMQIYCYDLFYTVIRSRDGKETVIDK